ncbi:hypothetical protein BC826DRAFT_1053826 [Russula brevipes]|nr:hypothetical protein BC826DRAFT_1053826 [Russula brevipes]
MADHRDRLVDSFQSLSLSGPPPPSPFFQSQTPPSSSPPMPGQSSRNVIDLTSSPSPLPQQPPPPAQHTTLESALPKTPVCIGRLDVTAIIMYPSAYLDISPSEPPGSDPVWGPVRLQYERTPYRSGSEDTISIQTSNKRSPDGEVHPGETFAIVEQRVASILGPMLGKGLIRLDSRIRRGNRHVPSCSPLELLAFTPKGNIPIIGNILAQCGLLLEHPLSIPTHILYYNPHNPSPCGHARAKNLRGGEELEETEPRLF